MTKVDMSKLSLTQSEMKTGRLMIAVSVKPNRMKKIVNAASIKVTDLSKDDFECLIKILNKYSFKNEKYVENKKETGKKRAETKQTKH